MTLDRAKERVMLDMIGSMRDENGGIKRRILIGIAVYLYQQGQERAAIHAIFRQCVDAGCDAGDRLTEKRRG